jgi:hypothetical protein
VEREAPLGAGRLDTFFPHGIPSAALGGASFQISDCRFQISDCRFQIVILIARNRKEEDINAEHAEAAERKQI